MTDRGIRHETAQINGHAIVIYCIRSEKLPENYILKASQKHSSFTKAIELPGGKSTSITEKLAMSLLCRSGPTVRDAVTESVSLIAKSMSMLK